MIQIKNLFAGNIIHQGDFNNIRECVEDAVQNGISLMYADLINANLINANLRGANLSGANLCDANLRGADLINAYLINANLRGANLTGANLCDANLRGANLTKTYLIEAILSNAKMPDKPVVLPPIGEAIVGYKKLSHDVVIKVEIPADAQRVSTWKNRKCRASALKVIEVIRNPDGIPTNHMPGLHDPNFIYSLAKPGTSGEAGDKLGGIHFPDQFDPDDRNDCLPGLHFFVTQVEAEEWG